MESVVLKKVPANLNYVQIMKLLFDGDERNLPNCASYTISSNTLRGKVTPTSSAVNDKKYKVNARIISTQDSSTKNENESDNLRKTVTEKDRNWDKQSGQHKKKNEPKVNVSDSFVNDAKFGPRSNDGNPPEYIESKKENRVHMMLKQIEGTSSFESINPDADSTSIPDELNFCRRVKMTSEMFKNCNPKLSIVLDGCNSCLEMENIEGVVTKNETHIDVPRNDKTGMNRLSINNLEENSNEILTKEYRTSLMEQIERDLDSMRQDGFLDDNVNITSNHVVNDDIILTTYVSRKRMRDSAISSPYSSTASTPSCSLDEYDEGIGMDKYVDGSANIGNKSLNNENGAERGGIQENVGDIFADKEVSTINGDSLTSKRLSYIVDEIKSTERKYVEDLMKIVRDFIPYILLHPIEFMEVQVIDDLFACIKDILRHQMDFLTAIEDFQDIDGIVETLISNNSLLRMYPNYFRNKPKTDELLDNFKEIFKEMQEKFGDLFDLSAYLLIPIQRLGKYKLFLEKIEKEQKKLNVSNNQTLMALDMVRCQLSRGNTYVAIDSIKDSPFGERYENYGSFVVREKFDKSKYMVFLFEKVVVFTTIDQTNSEIFHYHDSIKMENLNMTTFENFTILLNDSTKSKSVRHSKKIRLYTGS